MYLIDEIKFYFPLRGIILNYKKSINLIGPLKLDLALIDKRFYSIIVDGGSNHEIDFPNSLSIGDNDSTSKPNDIRLPQEKELSDLAFSLKEIPQETEEVFAYGFIGGRLDHQFFILGDICHFLDAREILFNFYDQKKVLIKVLPPGSHKIVYKGVFSVLSFQSQMLKLDGDIKYKIDNKVGESLIPYSSNGLSNEADGDILLINQKPIIMFFPDAQS